MAPTTLIGQNTTTTPDGRDAELHGYPVRVCELINQWMHLRISRDLP